MENKDNKFYVYAYLDPSRPGRFKYDNHLFGYEPFYIGKGFNDRAYKHLYTEAKGNDYNKLKNNKIKKLVRLGFDLKSFIIKVKQNLIEQESFYLEQQMIKLIGRRDLKLGPLCNLTNGGEGPSGVVYSEERIEQLRNFAKGNKYALGYHHTQETLEKISKSSKGHIVHDSQRLASSIANKGKFVSSETRNKLSLANTGRKLSTNHINKLKELRKGKKLPEQAYINSKKSIQILTDDKFEQMLELYKTGKYTDKELGTMFGVCRSTIGVRLKNFRHYKSPSKYPDELVKEIIKRKFVLNQSVKNISKDLNLTDRQIRNLCRNKNKYLKNGEKIGEYTSH